MAVQLLTKPRQPDLSIIRMPGMEGKIPRYDKLRETPLLFCHENENLFGQTDGQWGGYRVSPSHADAEFINWPTTKPAWAKQHGLLRRPRMVRVILPLSQVILSKGPIPADPAIDDYATAGEGYNYYGTDPGTIFWHRSFPQQLLTFMQSKNTDVQLSIVSQSHQGFHETNEHPFEQGGSIYSNSHSSLIPVFFGDMPAEAVGGDVLIIVIASLVPLGEYAYVESSNIQVFQHPTNPALELPLIFNNYAATALVDDHISQFMQNAQKFSHLKCILWRPNTYYATTPALQAGLDVFGAYSAYIEAVKRNIYDSHDIVWKHFASQTQPYTELINDNTWNDVGPVGTFGEEVTAQAVVHRTPPSMSTFYDIIEEFFDLSAPWK